MPAARAARALAPTASKRRPIVVPLMTKETKAMMNTAITIVVGIPST